LGHKKTQLHLAPDMALYGGQKLEEVAMTFSRLAPSPLAAVILSPLLLAGCSQQTPPPTAAAPPAMASLPPAFGPDAIVGRWGYAAYHNEADRSRIEGAARNSCNQPYVITRGPTGGVMMYLADESRLEELRLKGGPGAKTYIGPDGPPGDKRDREVVTFDGRVLVLRWLDPEVAGRYGTAVFVRCGARA
jgi:hypothetical protein